MAGGKKAAGAFERIRTSIGLENALVMDPRRYQLWVDAESQQAYFNLLGPSSGEVGQPIIVDRVDASAFAGSHQVDWPAPSLTMCPGPTSRAICRHAADRTI